MTNPPSSVYAIIAQAQQIGTPSERSAYLDEVCAGNPQLRRAAEALLLASDQALHPAANDAANALMPTQATAALGVRIGTGDAPTQPLTEAERPGGAVPGLDFLQPAVAPGALGRFLHYDVLQVLGQGGFGIVVKAFDDKLHRLAAIKVLGPQLTEDAGARRRFVREARAGAAVNDEHVVGVYAVDEHPVPHLVMEYIAGGTLQDLLDQHVPLELKEVLRIGQQIASGLAAAHAQGLIHRDIKPANILLEEGSRSVKITDFGLARAADDANASQSGIIAGTPLYMAPEQALDEPIDFRADLFSLGSVMYALCAGRPPFAGDTTLAVLMRVCEEPPPPLRDINPAIPPLLCEVVARLHAKQPAGRFASAQEVADIFAHCLSELHQRGKITSLSRQAGETMARVASARRRRRALAVAVLGVLLLGLAVGWRLSLANPSDNGNPPDLAAQSAKTFTNDLGMEFVLVPRGKAWLGGGGGTAGVTEVEVPHDFWLGKYEVTQEQWQKVMGTNPSAFSRTGAGADAVKDIPDDELQQFPVETISWADAQRFLQALNRQQADSGWIYRLPTKDQWEYACRGGPPTNALDSSFHYYLEEPGNQVLPGQMNFNNVRQRPSKAGSNRPNRLGLHDMHGNVWEWLADPAHTEGSVVRANRGGGWDTVGETSQTRWWGYNHTQTRRNNLGLRLARVAGGSETPAEFDAWLAEVAALPAEQQAAAVAVKLQDHNPGYDGRRKDKVAGGVVTEFDILADHVADIAPIRALTGLERFECAGTGRGTAQLADLSPLRGSRIKFLFFQSTDVSDLTPLKHLPLLGVNCGSTPVSSLAPLAGLKLEQMYLADTPVADLSPLRDMPLTTLDCSQTRVADLTVLKNMPLAWLKCSHIAVTDLSPLRGKQLGLLWCQGTRAPGLSALAGMPLNELWCDIRTKGDADILRAIKSLSLINNQPARQFWEARDGR